MRHEIIFKIGYVCEIPWGGGGEQDLFSLKSTTICKYKCITRDRRILNTKTNDDDI